MDRRFSFVEHNQMVFVWHVYERLLQNRVIKYALNHWEPIYILLREHFCAEKVMMKIKSSGTKFHKVSLGKGEKTLTLQWSQHLLKFTCMWLYFQIWHINKLGWGSPAHTYCTSLMLEGVFRLAYPCWLSMASLCISPVACAPKAALIS